MGVMGAWEALRAPLKAFATGYSRRVVNTLAQ